MIKVSKLKQHSISGSTYYLTLTRFVGFKLLLPNLKDACWTIHTCETHVLLGFLIRLAERSPLHLSLSLRRGVNWPEHLLKKLWARWALSQCITTSISKSLDWSQMFLSLACLCTESILQTHSPNRDSGINTKNSKWEASPSGASRPRASSNAEKKQIVKASFLEMYYVIFNCLLCKHGFY